jgi:hypothetical protein
MPISLAQIDCDVRLILLALSIPLRPERCFVP